MSAPISVLMPTYNAEKYVLRSLQSVLAQTFEDFELVVIDNGSTDATFDILRSIGDSRLRLYQNELNLGHIGSLNRAINLAQGHYIARVDADDLCMPTRLEKQKQYLDQHPEAVLVGTEMFILENGKLKPIRRPADPDPAVLRWQLHVGNPVGHPTMMFRADAVRSLGTYLDDHFAYAEDFDFVHRMMELGDIVVLPERLTIYRKHSSNLSRTRRDDMVASTASVLSRIYTLLLGRDSAEEARLVARHLMARTPIQDGAIVDRLGNVLDRLVDAFLSRHGLRPEQERRVIEHTSEVRWDAVLSGLREGAVNIERFRDSFRRNRFGWSRTGRPSLSSIASTAATGIIDGHHKLARALAGGRTGFDAKRPHRPFLIRGAPFDPAPESPDQPPYLYVVVDAEAEFDWSRPFDRSLTAVTSMAFQHRAQAIFDGLGIRPIYVVDYAVASQPEGYEPLRAFLDRRVCAIGAHLHPWINPPFEEVVSVRTSFSGNLAPELERRKLSALVRIIEQNLHVFPMFFKAGRYGLGPSTMKTLAELGLAVDFSILPGADLTFKGGPDFRLAEMVPYRTPDGILSVPMARGRTGWLAPLPPGFLAPLMSHAMMSLRVPGLLARLRLANTVTLTPEGIPAPEQLQLIRANVRRGYRTFVLHYHSPSLEPGHTPYVRTEADLASFLNRLETVCRYFAEQLGGIPGNPLDLLPPGARQRVSPFAPIEDATPEPSRHVFA